MIPTLYILDGRASWVEKAISKKTIALQQSNFKTPESTLENGIDKNHKCSLEHGLKIVAKIGSEAKVFHLFTKLFFLSSYRGLNKENFFWFPDSDEN